MRLIDAEELYKRFLYNANGERIPERDCDNFPVQINISDIKRDILDAPTLNAVVLSCNVGDIVYVLSWDGEIYECKVVCIHYSINRKQEIKHTIRLSNYNEKGYAVFTEDYNVSELGSRVFLTKKEAEQVLKEGTNSERPYYKERNMVE